MLHKFGSQYVVQDLVRDREGHWRWSRNREIIINSRIFMDKIWRFGKAAFGSY